MRQLRVAEVSLVGVAVTGTTGLRGSASRSFHVTYTGDEPITTGDAELVTGRMEQSRTAHQLTFRYGSVIGLPEQVVIAFAAGSSHPSSGIARFEGAFFV